MSEKMSFKRIKGLVFPEDQSYSTQREWHIFYVRPRSEAIVCRMLTNLGYEVFWPVVQKTKTWKNRQRRKISVALFPNYLFVYTYRHELYSIRGLPKVVDYVACGGTPSTISELEVEGIRRMLGTGSVISVETRFSKGEHVRIVSGPLKGHEGILIKRRSKSRFGIQLKAIDHAVFIEVSQSDLEKL